MKKIYAFLVGAVLASSAVAAVNETAPRFSMENASIVASIEKVAPKKVADKANVVRSRAEETQAPEVIGDYMLSCTNYSKSDSLFNTYLLPSANLVETEGEGKFQFEQFIYSDYSPKASLSYDPEFWKDAEGNWVGEWVLSLAVGETSEPLFYTNLSEYSSYGFTSHEPVYMYLVETDSKGKVGYYSDDTFDFVVRDGFLLAPYGENAGLALASRFIENAGAVTFGNPTLDLMLMLPNAYGTAEQYQGTNTPSKSLEYPLYVESFEYQGIKCLSVIGICGFPGQQIFFLNQTEGTATTSDMPLTVYDNLDLYMTQDNQSSTVIFDVTKETTGNSTLTADFIGLIDLADTESGLYGFYENIVINLDYNVWGDASGITAPSVDSSNAPVEYYNLQGMRVDNPSNGIFIRRQGSEATKVRL